MSAKRTFTMEPSSNNTATEEETMALRTKRARRVSFADKEITSVHIFRRDDTSSSGTPPGSAPSSSAKTAPPPELLGFFRDLAGDSDDDDDLKNSSSPSSRDNDDDGSGSFLRPIGSPSPGGSSSAAASTDDEDDFHGPVSAGFIRPERLSDSGVSDDVTMDSTAFSLHYRSLARSDSGDLKTPTRFRLQFEEQTPRHTSSPPPATGSFMALTEAKKQFSQPAEAASGCRDSNDMSIVGEDPQRYDYDRLPTALDKILAEGSEDLNAMSKTLDSETTDSPNINGSVMALGSISSPVDQFTHHLSGDNKVGRTVADASAQQIKTPDTSMKEIKDFVKDGTVLLKKQLDFLNSSGGRRTPLKMGEGNQLNVSAQSELRYSVGQVQGSNPEDRGQVTDINEKDSDYMQVETRHASLEEQLFSITQKNNMRQGLIRTDDHGIESFRNLTMLNLNEETVGTKMGEENFNLISADISYHLKNSMPVEITASPQQIIPLTRVTDCNLIDNTVENIKDDILSVTNAKPFSSPVKLLDQKLSQHAGQEVECNSEAATNEFGLSGSGNSGKPSSHSDIEQLIKFAKSASKRKTPPSPVKRFLFQSSPIQEATTLLPSLHEPSSELLHGNMQDFFQKGNSDAHCPLDNNYHPAFQLTPSQTSSPPAANGSFMVLTEAKKQCSLSAVPVDVTSGSGDSSDMSIVGENPQSYDYERLPTALDAVMVEGSKDLHAISHPLDSVATDSPNTNGSVMAQGSIDFSMDSVGKHDMSIKELAEAPCNDGCSISYPVDQVNHDLVDNKGDHTVADASIHQIKTPDISIKEIEEFVKDATVPVNKQLEFNAGRTPLKMGEGNQLHVSAQSELGYSAGQVQGRNPEDRGQVHDINAKASENKQVETPNASLQKQLFSITREHNRHQGVINTDDHGVESFGNITMLSQNEETVDTRNGEGSFNLISADISYNVKNSKLVEITTSPLQMTPLTRVRECNIVDSMVQNIKDDIFTNAKPFSSPVKLLDQKLSHVGSQRNCFGELKQLDNNQNESVNSGLGQNVECNSEAAAQVVEKLLLSNGDNRDKFGTINRSPEVHKIGNSDLQLVSEQTISMRGEREKLRKQTWNDWADILKKFFGGTQHLLSPSVDKLNLRLICMLEDLLVHLQKLKQCEILCSDIHPQKKITDPLNFSRRKRAVEARMLLLCISYKKAKLQLMHMKRERLLEKVQHLSSGLQESQMMKLNFISCSSKTEVVGTQANDSHIHTSLINSEGKCQVTEMRQKLENLAWKAKSLSGFFHSFCKMEGDRSCADIIESVCDYLQKRMSDKFIFQSLKSWAIEDFELKDGCYRIVLNYGGYIIQRFTVNAHRPSIIISNSFSDLKILKNFPGINAVSAFEFVLNTRIAKKCTGSTCLGQETQITSSFLSNLLDVVEEVQLSRIEIRNLVQATFFSHSVEQLDLRLFFIDFCSGRKVKVTLDMSCIKFGVYPVKVLPSQICGHASDGEHSLPSSLESGIRSSAESVRVGYSRIIRLCRRISQVVQTGTQSR